MIKIFILEGNKLFNIFKYFLRVKSSLSDM